ASYDLPVPKHYATILDHLDALRSHVRTLITWRDAEGIITFPSFHAVWAVLLTAAFWRRGWLFYAIGVLNLAVIAWTVTTGMHYFTDVLAGIAIAAGVIAATRGTDEEAAAKEVGQGSP